MQSYVNYLGQFGITASTGANYESAACLLMALQNAQSGGGSGSADIGGGGAPAAFGLSGGQSIRAFTDAWGQPLYFTAYQRDTHCSIRRRIQDRVQRGSTIPAIRQAS